MNKSQEQEEKLVATMTQEGETFLDQLFLSLETVPQDIRRDFELVSSLDTDVLSLVYLCLGISLLLSYSHS